MARISEEEFCINRNNKRSIMREDDNKQTNTATTYSSTMMISSFLVTFTVLLLSVVSTTPKSFVDGYVVVPPNTISFVSRKQQQQQNNHQQRLWMTTTTTTTTAGTETETTTVSFIDTELRGAAMRLHTREQAPKEGEAPATKREPYTPTHADYLSFLVDSQHVYKAFEDVVNGNDALSAFRNTGLERVQPLEHDIAYMIQTYNLQRPQVGEPGNTYEEKIRSIRTSIPEFVCHYYNWYFAHTAGGRMIGKQMSALLLDKFTLEFYKWDGDLNQIKSTVKQSIEEMALQWTEEEKQQCVDATADAFRGGGAVNSYLSGGQSPH